MSQELQELQELWWTCAEKERDWSRSGGSPRGLPQNVPPSGFTMPTDGTVTLRSGYIVSRIQLFIHFWVATCLTLSYLTTNSASAAVGLLWGISLYIMKHLFRDSCFKRSTWGHFFLLFRRYENTRLCEATRCCNRFYGIIFSEVEMFDLYEDVRFHLGSSVFYFQAVHLRSSSSLVVFKQYSWMSVIYFPGSSWKPAR